MPLHELDDVIDIPVNCTICNPNLPLNTDLVRKRKYEPKGMVGVRTEPDSYVPDHDLVGKCEPDTVLCFEAAPTE